MKRAAVFAHYDKDSIIDDYVVYYLRELREVCDKIVFVSCGNLSEEEKSKINGFADFIIAEPHKEYDFGSYKRGYLQLKPELCEYDELIFANDSCYGPFYPLAKVFENMNTKDCDFWGISKNIRGKMTASDGTMHQIPHIQSYFLVFKKNVFISECFDNFMILIKEEVYKNDIIINYEMGLTKLLEKNGFKSGTFIEAYKYARNVVLQKWHPIILKHKMPFMKCSLARLANKVEATVDDYPETIQKISNYPVELIIKNAERTMVGTKNEFSAPTFIKRPVLDFVTYLGGGPKRIALKVVKKLKFFFD